MNLNQQQIWVPGAKFMLKFSSHVKNGQTCTFLGWDDEDDNQDENYNYRYPTMEFADGTREDQVFGESYSFLHGKGLFYCHSLL